MINFFILVILFSIAVLAVAVAIIALTTALGILHDFWEDLTCG